MSEWLSSRTTSSEESARPTKLGVRTEGPSTIECVHIDCNLTTLLRKGITERINIRRDLLYCWPFCIPLWRQFLAWIVFEVFTFYLWSFFSTSHSSVLGRQANLKESSKSKELAELRLKVLVDVKTSDACESKKEIMRLKSDLQSEGPQGVLLVLICPMTTPRLSWSCPWTIPKTYLSLLY